MPAQPRVAAARQPAVLQVRIKRAPDGSAALSCVRPDGSVTWQKQKGAQAHVLPTHDITHFAVETTLGYRNGFFGLIASGWDIADFAAPWPRGPIPAEAREVELVVGLFDLELRAGERWNAARMLAEAELYVGSRTGKAHVPMPRFDDEALEHTRATRHACLTRWNALPAGGTLELAFPC